MAEPDTYPFSEERPEVEEENPDQDETLPFPDVPGEDTLVRFLSTEGYNPTFRRPQPNLEGKLPASKEAKAQVLLDLFGARIDVQLKGANKDLLENMSLVESKDPRKKGVVVHIRFRNQDVVISVGKTLRHAEETKTTGKYGERHKALREFLKLINTAKKEYFEQTAEGQVERAMSVEEAVSPQSLEGALKSVSQGLDERAIGVAEQVLEALRRDNQQVKDDVRKETTALRQKFDETMDKLAQRSDLNRLVEEVSGLSEEVGNYVQGANKALSTTLSDVSFDTRQVAEQVKRFDERLDEALESYDNNVERLQKDSISSFQASTKALGDQLKSFTEKVENMEQVARAQDEATKRVESSLNNVVHQVSSLPREFPSLSRVEEDLQQLLQLVQKREVETSVDESAERVENAADALDRGLLRLEKAIANRQDVQEALDGLESATRSLEAISRATKTTSRGDLNVSAQIVREVLGALRFRDNVTSETPNEFVEPLIESGETEIQTVTVRIDDEPDMTATLITTIVAVVRAAAKKVGSGISTLGKEITALGKKLGPILGPVLSLVGAIVKLGAKGVSWLAKNLWLLALLIVYFLVQEVRRKR